MIQSKEIELKLSYKNKKLILKQLSPVVKYIKKVKIKDAYYGFFDPKMKNSNEIIRMRTLDNKKSELTFKSQVKNRTNIWHRKELSVSISSPKTMEQILFCLKIKKYYGYESVREYWKYHNSEIVFVKFSKPAFLKFMEIEGRTAKDIKEIKRKIESLVIEVGEEFFSKFDKARKK